MCLQIWVSAWQNLQLDLFDQRWLRSACATAQSDQSLSWSHVPSTTSRLSKEGWTRSFAILGGYTGWSESAGYTGLIVLDFVVRWLICVCSLLNLLQKPDYQYLWPGPPWSCLWFSCVLASDRHWAPCFVSSLCLWCYVYHWWRRRPPCGPKVCL